MRKWLQPIQYVDAHGSQVGRFVGGTIGYAVGEAVCTEVIGLWSEAEAEAAIKIFRYLAVVGPSYQLWRSRGVSAL